MKNRKARRSQHRQLPKPISRARFRGLEMLETRTMLSAAIALTPSGAGGAVSQQAGLTVYSLPAGGVDVTVTVNITPTDEPFNTYQLDFLNSDLAAGQLQLTNWTPAGPFSPQDATLNAPGDSFVSGISFGIITTTAAVGSFTVAVPQTPGDYLITANRAPGVGAGTAIAQSVLFPSGDTPLSITNFGDLVIHVPGSVVPIISIDNTSATEGNVAPPGLVQLDGTVRDFIGQGTTSPNQGSAVANPDFENAAYLQWRIDNPGVIDPGIVAPALGLDGKPVFAGPTNTSSSADNFNQWYNDDPAVNMSAPLDLTMTRHANDPSIYSFQAPNFYPIDNQLFGNTVGATLPDPLGINPPTPVPPIHNWNFTWEGHGQFQYQSGQFITATADDDIWVFINGQLVIDRGGVNIAITQSVSLDDVAGPLGLQDGGTYNIDIFYAERHTDQATLDLTTNFAINAVGASALQYEVFDVTLSQPTTVAVSVDYGTIDGSATAGSDYLASSGTLTFQPGQTDKKIFIPIIGDADAEPTEIFTLALDNPVNATLIGQLSSGTATIFDDDNPAGPSVTLVATDPAADEQTLDPGLFTVTRTGHTDADLPVFYTVGGTASSGVDYDTLTNEVTIPEGQSSAQITITPTGDSLPGGSATVVLDISPNVNYDLGTPTEATVTITGSDQPPPLPTVSITASDSSANELTLDPGAFAVTRTGATDNDLVVSYILGGTAINGQDYQSLTGIVTIPAGQSTVDITVTPIDDQPVDGSQSVIAFLVSDPAYAIGAPSSDTVTIIDGTGVQLPAVTIVATDPNAAENGQVPGTFTVTRTGPTDAALVVNYTLTGTATNGLDYATLTGSVTIPVNQPSADITVTPIDNQTIGGTETVVATLAPAAAYTLGSPSSDTVDIADNDTAPVPGDITGIVFHDIDGNGLWSGESAEPSFAGVTVALYIDTNQDHVIDAGDQLLATATTARASGGAAAAFDFPDLPLGQYLVAVTDTNNVLSGLFLTDPQPVAVNITQTESTHIFLGYGQQPQGTGGIVGAVYHDLNHNFFYDPPGDPSFAGVQIELFKDTNANSQLDAGDQLVDTTTTFGTQINPNQPFYAFAGLAPGVYFVKVSDPNHVLAGLTPELLGTTPITVSTGQTIENDFPYIAPIGPTPPDLTIQFDPNQVIAAPLIPGDKNTVTGSVNIAEGILNATIVINVYLLPAGQSTPGVNDKPVGTTSHKGKVLEGVSFAWKVATTLPANLALGSYHFVAFVDATNVVPEPDEDNNTAALPDMNLAFEAGAILGRKSVKSVAVHGIVYSITGPGTLQIIPGSNGQPDSVLVNTDNTGTTAIAAKTTVGGATEIQNLTITGSVKSANFKGIAIAGNVTAGLLGSLTTGNIAGLIAITGSDPTDKATFSLTADDVDDLNVESTIAIKAIKVLDWTDTGDTRDAITAPSIGAIASAGDFNADITLADTALKVTLTSLKANGILTSTIRAASIGTITAGRIVNSLIFAGVEGDVAGLPTRAADFLPNSAGSSIAKVVALGLSSGPSFVNSFIAAPTIGTVTLKDALSDNSGVLFGVAAHTVIKAFTLAGFPPVKNLIAPGDHAIVGDLILRIV